MPRCEKRAGCRLLRMTWREWPVKRAFDISVAALSLPLAVLVIRLCAVAIRLTSPGPVVLRQPRIGRGGQIFTCYKLRTMRTGTKIAPSHQVSATAVTSVGRYLRRLKLDELPQLLNIIRGEMSFVGPRPCLPSQTELIEARRALGLDRIPPGITGVSQVRGVDMSDPARLAQLDATYLRDMSVRTDLKLIIATALGSGRGDRVNV